MSTKNWTTMVATSVEMSADATRVTLLRVYEDGTRTRLCIDPRALVIRGKELRIALSKRRGSTAPYGTYVDDLTPFEVKKLAKVGVAEMKREQRDMAAHSWRPGHLDVWVTRRDAPMAKARVAGWTCDEWLFVQSGKILGTLTTDGALDVSDTEDLSIGAGVTHVGTGSVVLGELSSRPSMTPDVLRAKPRSVVEWRRMADYLLTHGGGTGIELVTDVGGITKEMKDRLGEALAKYKEMRDSEE